MFDSWKFSKGSYLVIIFTASTGTLILGFAYHLRHFSEILSGVIGGLTIILGMITAEWFRSSSQQIEETRTSHKNLVLNLERLLYSYDEFAADQYSRENYVYWEQYERCSESLLWLARSTRWPLNSDQGNDVRNRFDAYRKTSPNGGLPLS
jgi:hypothetical protein